MKNTFKYGDVNISLTQDHTSRSFDANSKGISGVPLQDIMAYLPAALQLVSAVSAQIKAIKAGTDVLTSILVIVENIFTFAKVLVTSSGIPATAVATYDKIAGYVLGVCNLIKTQEKK